MGMVMGVTAVILGIAAGMVGLLVWTALIFPLPAARSRAALETRPGRCFVAGIALALILGVPVISLFIPFVGWFLFAPLVGLVVTGAGALGCIGFRKGTGLIGVLCVFVVQLLR